MNLLRPPGRLLLLSALTSLLSLAACGRIPGQFEIISDQVPMAGTSGCMVPVGAATIQGVGRLDLSIVRGDADSAYLFFPLLKNNLPGPTGSGPDTNQIQMSGFNVDVTALAGTTAATDQVLADNSSYAHFRAVWSGGIDSGGGEMGAIVDAVPVALATQLLNLGGVAAEPSALLNLHVQAIGTTVGGTAMQSDPFDFPVEICVGCLVANVQACPYMSAPANPGNPCNPAQDDPVDCCTDNGALICPPPVAAQ
jgi:hypothetical protein